MYTIKSFSVCNMSFNFVTKNYDSVKQYTMLRMRESRQHFTHSGVFPGSLVTSTSLSRLRSPAPRRWTSGTPSPSPATPPPTPDHKVGQWAIESVSQWVSELVSHWVSDSVSQRVIELMSHWISKLVCQWVSESLSHWVTESLSHWISDSVSC